MQWIKALFGPIRWPINYSCSSKKRPSGEAVQAIEAHNRAQAMSAKIQQYHTYAPGWNQQGTPAHQRANSEYQNC